MSEANVRMESPVSALAWYAVGILALSNACAYLDQAVIGVLAEPIKHSLQLSDLQLGLLQGPAFAVSFALFTVPLARLADRRGRKMLLVLAMASWSAMTGLCGLAGSFLALALARVGLGVGQAALVPAGNSIIADLFGVSSFGRATGVFMLGGAAGAGLVLTVGGPALVELPGIAESLGLPPALPEWRLAFVVLGLLGLLLVVLLVGTLKEPKRQELTSPAAMTGAPETLIGLWRSHSRGIIWLLLASCFIAIVVQSWLAWTPAFLIRKFHIAVAESAYWLGLDILTFGAIGTIIAGVLLDKLFQRGYPDAAMRTATAGSLGCSVLAIATALAPAKHGAVLSFGLFLLCTSLVSVSLPPLISMLVPNRIRGQAIAVLILFSGLIGAATGPALVGMTVELAFKSARDLDHALLLISLVFGPAAVYCFHRTRLEFHSPLPSTGQASE